MKLTILGNLDAVQLGRSLLIEWFSIELLVLVMVEVRMKNVDTILSIGKSIVGNDLHLVRTNCGHVFDGRYYRLFALLQGGI